jgi:hypothetical protein
LENEIRAISDMKFYHQNDFDSFRYQAEEHLKQLELQK